MRAIMLKKIKYHLCISTCSMHLNIYETSFCFIYTTNVTYHISGSLFLIK